MNFENLKVSLNFLSYLLKQEIFPQINKILGLIGLLIKLKKLISKITWIKVKILWFKRTNSKVVQPPDGLKSTQDIR